MPKENAIKARCSKRVEHQGPQNSMEFDSILFREETKPSNCASFEQKSRRTLQARLSEVNCQVFRVSSVILRRTRKSPRITEQLAVRETRQDRLSSFHLQEVRLICQSAKKRCFEGFDSSGNSVQLLFIRRSHIFILLRQWPIEWNQA